VLRVEGPSLGAGNEVVLIVSLDSSCWIVGGVQPLLVLSNVMLLLLQPSLCASRLFILTNLRARLPPLMKSKMPWREVRSVRLED